MTAARKPLLLLDVDGVLAPFGMATKPTSYEQHTLETEFLGDHKVWLNPAHGQWLASLEDVVDLAWCTGWEDEAPRLLGPMLNIKPAPVVRFRERDVIDLPLNKLPAVTDFVSDRAVVWIDDNHSGRETAWAKDREAPTLLITPNHNVGLSQEHIAQARTFAEDLLASTARQTTA